MKNLIIKFVVTFAISTIGCLGVFAQNNIGVSDSAAGLDLYAVAETFKASENLEKFEQTINNSENGINNLD